MTTEEKNQRAAEYVDRIITINKNHGGVVSLTAEERQKTIAAAAAAFRGLRSQADQ